MTGTQQHFRLMKIAIYALIILAILAIAPTGAIGVLGAKYMGSIAPGASDTHVLTINVGAGEEATDLIVEVAGFGQNSGGVYSPLDAAIDISPYSARSFITLDKSSVHIEPGKSEIVKATINVP